MHGLDWYDYEARMMDPNLGSMPTIDPLCEKYYPISPYVYCSNNPINQIDPDGRTDYLIYPKTGQILKVGNPNNKADRNLLPGLAKNKGRDVNDRKTHQATANMGDAATVFKFAADNSEVEWKLDVYVGDDGRLAILGNNMIIVLYP